MCYSVRIVTEDGGASSTGGSMSSSPEDKLRHTECHWDASSIGADVSAACADFGALFFLGINIESSLGVNAMVVDLKPEEDVLDLAAILAPPWALEAGGDPTTEGCC